MQQAIQSLGQLNTAAQRTTQTQTQDSQSTRQLVTVYLALIQAVQQQVQAYSQAQAAALQYRQSQDQIREALRQQREEQRQAATAAREAARVQREAARDAAAAVRESARQQREAARQVAREQREAAQQAAAAARASSSGLQTALSVAGGIGLATSIGSIVSALKDFATSAVDVGVRMESLRTSLGALAGNMGAGAAQFQQLFAQAQQLGVAFEPLARGWRQLTAAATQANVPIEDQRRLLTALVNEARRTGASNEELGRAITAVSQIASKGVVSMEELRQQLGEALPTAMAAAARGMGVTTEELNKLVETGTLRFQPFIRALTRGFEEMQQASKVAVDGSREAFNRLGNALLAFKDALGQNVLPELARIARVAQTILETATSILNVTGGRGGPAPVGPSMETLQPTAAQQQELDRLGRLIERYQREQGLGTPVMQQQRAEMLEQAKQAREELLELIRTQRQSTYETEQSTEAENRRTGAIERQRDFTERLTKALDDLQKARAKFREEAALQPERLGSPTGTLEQQKTFAKEQQKFLDEPLQKIGETISARPPGVTVPDDLRKRVIALDKEYGVLGKTLDDVNEKIREGERAATRARTQAEQAAAQALQLDSLFERIRTFMRRPEETSAEEAASRIRQQGTAMEAALGKEILLLEKSAALRKERPGALEQAKELRDALPQATEALAVETMTAALEKQIKPLEDLANQYNETSKAVDDLAKAEAIAAKLVGTAMAERAKAAVETIRLGPDLKAARERRQEMFKEMDILGLNLTPDQERARAFETKAQQTLARLQTPRDERASLALRQQATRQGIQLTEQDEALLQLIQKQERWNTIMDAAGRIGDQAAQTITQGLMGIVEGTQRVGEGFKSMAKAILDSVAQITLNEGFRLLISLGLRAIGSYFAPGSGSALGAAGNSGAYMSQVMGTVPQMQHGGMVSKPTLILAGEGSSATNPEYIFNRPQMQALMQGAMRAGPSAGGQAAGISIINVASQEQAQKEAARERALGRQVIINEVMADLGQGEGSRIGRVMRTLQR
jgi:tape measure domain-containing protein